MSGLVEFTCPNGSTAKGYLAEADNAKGGVIVIQEWWGLNPQIQSVADRFAAAGYHALAPDLYQGRVTQEPDEASHMMSGLDWVGATEQDVRGAAQYLRGIGADKTAVMGFCMGGALTVIAGVKVPECDAGICFYGIPPKEQADPAEMKVPFQAHFASQDDWCSPEAVIGLEGDMQAVSTPVEIHKYEGTEHGFFNQTREVYNADATALSWERMMGFLSTHIG